MHYGVDLQVIERKIYEIRGQRVMLDFDLAELYGIENKQLKRSVKRNIERFEGDDFMFEVTREELSRCQFGTLNKGRGSNIKYLPFAFTELGVAMLSSVLNTKTAIEVNRGIMRAFVALRHLLPASPDSKIEKLQQGLKELREYVEEFFTDQNDINEDTRLQMELINQALAGLQVKQKAAESAKCPPIGFIKPENR